MAAARALAAEGQNCRFPVSSSTNRRFVSDRFAETCLAHRSGPGRQVSRKSCCRRRGDRQGRHTPRFRRSGLWRSRWREVSQAIAESPHDLERPERAAEGRLHPACTATPIRLRLRRWPLSSRCRGPDEALLRHWPSQAAPANVQASTHSTTGICVFTFKPPLSQADAENSCRSGLAN